LIFFFETSKKLQISRENLRNQNFFKNFGKFIKKKKKKKKKKKLKILKNNGKK
jgi:hypothetical protein